MLGRCALDRMATKSWSAYVYGCDERSSHKFSPFVER